MTELQDDGVIIDSENTDPILKEPAITEAGTRDGMISWRRVLVTVSAIALVIVPSVFYLALSGELNYGREGSLVCPISSAAGGTHSAFDLSTSSIPPEEIRHGGPPKDGIPALSRPSTLPGSEADYLDANDRVIGVSLSGHARAYPLKILNYHEIVNDVLGDVLIVVTYCPLCDSAAVFDRRTELGPREIGVSGLLYNSNVLMYDRASKVESLWSQVLAQGVTGPATEKSLTALPLELTTWSDWRSRFPDTTVLSPKTGHQRDYSRSPYQGYFESDELIFPAEPSDNRIPTKERILGVWSGNQSLAFPESSFDDSNDRLETTINGKELTIEFDSVSKSMIVTKADEGLQWMYSLWFAWYAMHPETGLYQPPQ